MTSQFILGRRMKGVSMKILLIIILCLFSFPTYANANDHEIKKLFTDWTYSFNHKNLQKTCGLFAKEVVANYRGLPQKNYDSICNGFKKIFTQTNTIYHYRFAIHKIYQANNLAVVRITWYLQIKNGSKVTAIRDEGMDVLKRNANRQWQIVNYIAYSTD